MDPLAVAGFFLQTRQVPVFILILLLLLLLNLLWLWWADYLLRRRGSSWRWRIWPLLVAGGMGGLLAAFIFSFGWRTPAHATLPMPVIAALYLWYLLVLPTWLIGATVMAVAKFLAWLGRVAPPSEADPPLPQLSRRRFLTTLAVAAPPAMLGGLTAASLPQLDQFRIRRFAVPVQGLPKTLDGLTIAHVTDAHVGAFTFGRTVAAIADATNSLRADLVLLAGDLINNHLDDLPQAIAMVQAMEARHGVFLCEGNHDLIPGPGRFERQCKAAGLNLLVNEEKTIQIRGEPVQLLGLRWGSPRGPNRTSPYSDEAIAESMQELLELRNAEAFPVLLAHHPHAFDPAAKARIPLIVAGHTHGGQLMINEKLGFGPAMFRYWTGLYRKGGSTLAVSNGVGNWFPLRTAAPAEILHLTLKAGEAAKS